MKLIDRTRYPIAEGVALPSPRLLVFRERLEANIHRMRELLEEIATGSGFTHLMSHVKTQKSSWTTRLLIDAGMRAFKATPNELDMLLAAGAEEVFVAYPLVATACDWLCERIAREPDRRILAQVSCPEHVAWLDAAAAQRDVEVSCFIDLDVGMHRTGVAPAGARVVFDALAVSDRLHFAGLHAYDGHNKGRTPAERRAAAAESMQPVIALARALGNVPRVVAGGTPGFLPDLEILLESLPPETKVQVSPGTWVYWDSNYDASMPGLFEIAALIFARVMDRTTPELATLDLGHKRWGIDAGPVERFSVEGLRVAGTSEEHTVLELSGEARELAVGDAVLIAPRHVCSTVNLWEDFTVIGPGGEIEVESAPIDARNR